jgi:hypothetical protein
MSTATMKLRLLALSVLVAVSTASGQSTACPITITNVRNIESKMFVDFRNSGSATISSFQFGFTFVDVRGKSYTFPFLLGGSGAIGVGQEHTSVFPNIATLRFLFPKANAYLLRAAYSNGAKWTDDGSHACSITTWQE